MIGDGARVLAQRALGASCADGVNGVEPALLERTTSLFLEHYARCPVVDTGLLPGARETLEVSARLGIPSALVTNKPRRISVLVLEQLGVLPSFRAVFAGGDGPLKPAPDGIQSVVRELGVRIQDAWMIGDGPQDVFAGRTAGCFTIAVPGGIASRERLLAAAPDLVVASLHEVVDLLRSTATITSARS